MKTKNLVGKKFGRWLVVKKNPSTNNKKSCWKVKCVCGNIGLAQTSDLKSKKTRSCGCLRNEVTVKRSLKHGMRYTSEYGTWRSMLKRCYNKKQNGYKNYGGRGIKVCKKWFDFETFIKDMGKKPTLKHSIDRIDNNKGYFPSNCHWANSKQQNNNKRKNENARNKV